MAERIIGGATPKSENESYWSGSIVWVTPPDVSKNSRITESGRMITDAGLAACAAEIAPAGSIVITTRAPVGNVAVLDVAAASNQGCKTVVPHPKQLDTTFAYYMFLNLGPALRDRAAGSTFQEISTTSFASTPITVPPLDEQRAIARFLDRKSRRIARFIHARQRMIALLNEQKQAIIHQAVTRGLDPDVPLKPSGIDWLGDIPTHWTVRPLKSVAQVQTGLTLGKTYRSSQLTEYPYLRVANVQDGYLDLERITTVLVPTSEAASSKLMGGDVLMTEGGDIDKLGRGAVWTGEIANCLHQNHVFAVRPDRTRLDPNYLVVLMGSGVGREYFQRTAKRTTNLAATNSTTLGQFPMPLPKLEEQAGILDYLGLHSKEIKRLESRAHREIDLLREYRTRLIADVVTGKLDIRDYPDAAEDTPDDLDELSEIESTLGTMDGFDADPDDLDGVLPREDSPADAD